MVFWLVLSKYTVTEHLEKECANLVEKNRKIPSFVLSQGLLPFKASSSGFFQLHRCDRQTWTVAPFFRALSF